MRIGLPPYNPRLVEINLKHEVKGGVRTLRLNTSDENVGSRFWRPALFHTIKVSAVILKV